MADLVTLTHAHMRNLVQAFGCLDAVAASVNARWGGSVTKSTLSKKLAGHLWWTVPEVAAVEDALRRYPVTQMMARRGEDPGAKASGSLLVLSGAIAKETGEAISAILSAEQSAEAEDRARAMVEIDEAIEKLVDAKAKLAGAGR